jgi:predicted metal-binding protein
VDEIKQGRTTVMVCIKCRAESARSNPAPAGVELAAEAVRALGSADDVSVREVPCLGNCSRGLTAAIQRPDGWTYVYGGLRSPRDAPALIEGARLLMTASDGLMPWKGRPEVLKRGLIARVPPLRG